MATRTDAVASTGTRSTGPVVLVLTAGVTVVGAQALALSPLLPDVAASLGTDVPGVGRAVAAYGIALSVTALAASAVLDRWPLRRVLVAATAALGAALASAAVAPTLVTFGLAQAASGAAAGLVLPATYALAARVAPPDQVARVTGRVLLGWSLAMALGVPLAALLGDTAGWRAVFAALAALALVQAAGAALVLPDLAPEDGGGKGEGREGEGRRPRYVDTLRVPQVPRLLLAVAGYMAAFYAAYAYLGDEVRAAQGVGALGASVAVLAYGAGFGAAALLDGVIDRAGPRRVLAPALATLALVYVLLTVTTGSTALLVAVCVAWGMVNHVGLTVLVALLGQAAPERRGAVLALYSATTYAAGGLATAGAGRLLEVRGYDAVAVAAALAVLLAAGAALGGRTRRRSS